MLELDDETGDANLVETSASEDEYGPNPFAGMSDGSIARLQKSALQEPSDVHKRTRDEPGETSTPKRLAIAKSVGPTSPSLDLVSIAEDGINPVEEGLSTHAGTERSRKWILERPCAVEAVKGHVSDKTDPADEDTGIFRFDANTIVDHDNGESELEYVPQMGLSTRPTSGGHRRLQALRASHDARPAVGPPTGDLNIYGSGKTVSRAFYQQVLRKVGFSGHMAYSVPRERYDRQPSPDLLPFMAPDDDDVFRHGGEILPSGAANFLGGFDNGRPVYYPLDEHHFSKLLQSERKLLGIDAAVSFERTALRNPAGTFFRDNFERLSPEEKSAVFDRHKRRMEKKYSGIEFAYELHANGEVSIDGRTFIRLDDLGSPQVGTLLRRYVARRPEDADLVFLRKDRSPAAFFYASGVLAEMGVSERLAAYARPGTPFLLGRQQQRAVLEGGYASFPPETSQCILVGMEAGPKYRRLNRHQVSLITNDERLLLGFEPSWIRSLSAIDRYDIGLLPPGSLAMADALQHDREFARYIAVGSTSDAAGSRRQAKGALRPQSPHINGSSAAENRDDRSRSDGFHI